MTSLLVLAGALLGLVVVALLLVEYYQQPLLAVAAVSIGFWVLVWAAIEAVSEFRGGKDGY